MKNNKGLSLVEVIVALAVMSMIIVAVTSFMQVGIKTSNVASTDASLQREAQTVLNQMNEWMMESTKGIVVYPASPDYDQAVAIYNDGEEPSNKFVHIIYLRKADQNLYYHKVMIDATFTGSETDIKKDAAAITVAGTWKKYLLSNHVENMTVDVSKMSDQIISVKMDYTLQGKSYSFSNRIRMRNTPASDPTAY